MNIVLFVNKDLESNFALHLLKDELSRHNVRIYYSESVGRAGEKPVDLARLQFFERDFVYGTVADTLRSYGINTSFEFFGESFSMPLQRCDDVNDRSFIRALEDFRPDVFLSIRFGKIFHEAVIQVPPMGILNLHSAILPDYRGILGTLHALKEQRKLIGCTLHYITSHTIDTGGIIDITTLEVDASRSLFWHVMNLYVKGCASIGRNLQALALQNKLPVRQQQTGQGRYFSNPTTEDFEHLKRSGFSVITAPDYLEFFEKWVSPELSKKLCDTEEIRHLG